MANFNITYNKLTQYFQYFADGHMMIKRFHSGPAFDKNTFGNNDNNWPIFYMEFVSSIPRMQTKEYNIRFYALDRKQKASGNKDMSNEMEVISDSDLILDHLTKYIKSDRTNKLNIVSDFVHYPITNYLTEFCSGCYVDAIIKVPFNPENCDIPWSGTTTGSTTVTYPTL